MSSNGMLISRLADGSVAVVLFWQLPAKKQLRCSVSRRMGIANLLLSSP